MMRYGGRGHELPGIRAAQMWDWSNSARGGEVVIRCEEFL